MSSLADIPKEAQCREIIYQASGAGRAHHSHVVIWPKGKDYGWCKTCRVKLRPKASSLLYGSKLSYRQLYQLIWCWQQRQSPGSAKAIASVEYVAVRRWYKRWREYLPPDSTPKLAGIVEVDEAYFGKQRYGHQVIIVGAIERLPSPTTGVRRLKLQIIPDTEPASLELFLQHNVERGSLVVTDCHMGYSDIEWLGYSHETWNHSQGHFAGTNHIEQNWSAMKRYMRKLYGSVPTKELQLILDEWQARHNQPELFSSPENYLRAVVPD